MISNESNQQPTCRRRKSESPMVKSKNEYSIFNIQYSFLLFWIICFLLPMSCVEESERLTKAERKIVDSLVVKQTKILRVEGDSICELNFHTSVDQAVDSIMTVRREEIKKILNQ